MNELAIIYEDNHILVVIKPQGLPCCADKSEDMDLLTMLKEHRKANEEKPGEAFVGLVHRLDRVTGGVMVYAKTTKAAARLSEQLKNGEFYKKYLTIVKGSPKERSGKLENHLLKNSKTNKVDIVGAAVSGAKRAELDYNVRTVLEKVSLVEVELVTGRSHQIRAQFSHIGNPVLGDKKYGGWPEKELALWAHELKFKHPTQDQVMAFVVNPPEDEPWTKFDFNRKAHKLKEEG
ncbi:MAG: RluA family pseudouridine synthase [Firmicutes bacterium]|nr:RluA family pseudouridine synthase [Bacillota bacterium]